MSAYDNKKDLEIAVQKSTSYKEVLILFNKSPTGSSYKTLQNEQKSLMK
jgi:hypothetical protein